LGQHHVVTALGAVRIELAALAQATSDPGRCREALDKAIDFDLAIMAGAQREEELLVQAQSERATTMGMLVGTMCHELRNPLSVMESSVFLLQGHLGDDPRAQKHLDRISQQIGLSERRIGGMLDLIRDRPLRLRRLKLAEVLGPAVAQAAVPTWIRVTLAGLEDAPDISGDLKRLLELFGQLLQNALQAIGEAAGEIRITGQRGPDQDVLISIADSGPGVPAWLLPKLFEPLSTSHSGQLGLGLAQVRRAAELHRGRVEYHPGPPHRFTVSLPQA
jgi:signal transduction histidine kinase